MITVRVKTAIKARRGIAQIPPGVHQIADATWARWISAVGADRVQQAIDDGRIVVVPESKPEAKTATKGEKS